MLVDAHCHLADEAFDDDQPAVVERASAAGVHHIVVVGENVDASERAAQLATDDPRLSSTAGVHPHEASAWSREAEEHLDALLTRDQVVAVGETGLDYHYDHSPRAAQRAAFEAQLALGARSGKPVVIHTRDADDDMVAMLRNAPAEAVCIMHSFSGGDALLAAALDRCAYVSFSGMVTFKNWRGDEWIRSVPDDRLMVETDAPYLAPVPHRGRRNEPQYVSLIAQRVAEVRGISSDAVAELVAENTARCFGERTGRRAEV